MNKETKGKNVGERRKMISESTKDYFLLDNRIYPVDTLTQRAKLESLKDFIEFQQDKKFPFTPIRRPTAPPINLKRDLKELSTEQKRQICAEIEKNLNISKHSYLLRKLEKEMDGVLEKMKQQTEVNRVMLQRLERQGQLSAADAENKMEFFERLLQRKQGFVANILKMFGDIFTKESLNDRGEITLTDLLYSSNSLGCLGSCERLKSEEQLTSQKDLLIKTINENLELISSRTNQDIQFDITQEIQEEKKPPFQLSIPMIPMIPMIMTKDKREEIEREQEAAQKKMADCEIEHRIATQLSLIQRITPLDDDMVDTGLAAVGIYLGGLSEYILERYFQDIIELINMPFGKPAIERLSELQTGDCKEQILPFILSEKLFEEYEQLLKSNPCEREHHKILFVCLNFSLNIYRPYYNFKGQIYPWLTTSKGMTFYSISDANIEEVLEKCKISIMEKAASLCGVIEDKGTSPGSNKVYKQKRGEREKRMIHQEVLSDFNWLQTEENEAKIMLHFGRVVLDYLIGEVVQETQSMHSLITHR